MAVAQVLPAAVVAALVAMVAVEQLRPGVVLEVLPHLPQAAVVAAAVIPQLND